jgi:cyanosortase A-associated protein
MHRLSQLRFALLGLVASAGLVVLAKSMLDPNLGQPTPYTFPAIVNLSGWSPTDQGKTLIDRGAVLESAKVHYKVGIRYQYAINRQILDIDLRYLVRTKGDVIAFLQEYTDIKLKPEELQKDLRFRPGLGYYILFTDQNRVYLSACINPRGQSTVTAEQFDQNMTAEALKPSTIASWLLGQADLRDRRCLWTKMSAALDGDLAIAVEQRLENAWFLWYEWWKMRFPMP